MADFLPFRGTRYRDVSDLSAVVAPPYDVIDAEEQARLEAKHPDNAVRLILPTAVPPADPYRAAAALLDSWHDTGVVATDPEPAFYWYRMRTPAEDASQSTVGVIGALRLPHDGDGDVLGHERTLPKARSDRLALLRATRANLDPIWCLSLAADLTERLDAPGPPTAVATDDRGIVHELVPVRAPDAVEAIRETVRGAPLVLADGHHRFETACAYRAERGDDPAAESIMTFVAPLDEASLDVQAIHRLVNGAEADLRARLASSCDVEAVGPNTELGLRELLQRMRDHDGIGLVDRDGLALLSPTPTSRAAIEQHLPVELRGVDAARFDVAIRPALGDAQLSYRDDAATVASMVAKGAVDAAFVLRPVTVAQIRAAAFARLRMPEKTTFFTPKPRTGMVFRRLDD